MTVAAAGSLARMIVDDMNLVLDGPDFKAVYKHTIAYILGLKHILGDERQAFAHQAFLKQYCGATDLSAKTLRMRVLNSKHVSSVKMFTMRLSLLRSPVESDLVSLAKEFGVRMSDARRIHAILLDDPVFKLKTRAAVRELPAGESQLSVKYNLELFSRIYQSVYVYIKFLVWKKLTFVARTENQTLEDLQSEVILKVVQCFNKIMPTDMSELHVANYLRRTAHHHIMNMIAAATTLKRGRLINTGVDHNNEPTFVRIVNSENQLNVNNVDGETVNYDEIGCDYREANEKLDLRITVSQMLDQSKERDAKKFKMLVILMGGYSKRFTLWLRQRGLCGSYESNVEFQLRVPADTFLNLVGTHLGIEQTRFERIVRSVKADLGANTAPKSTATSKSTTVSEHHQNEVEYPGYTKGLRTAKSGRQSSQAVKQHRQLKTG